MNYNGALGNLWVMMAATELASQHQIQKEGLFQLAQRNSRTKLLLSSLERCGCVRNYMVKADSRGHAIDFKFTRRSARLPREVRVSTRKVALHPWRKRAGTLGQLKGPFD